jgi:uroporphyrinogen-III synthase
VNRVLVLRPEPGAGETAARAAALGLDPVVAPLFVVTPVAWARPPGHFDAILFTSANAPRLAGAGMADVRCYAVGEATAAAARAAGFADVRAGPSDGAAAAAMMAAEGVRRALHLCGRDHIAVGAPGVAMARCIVYAAEAEPRLPGAARAALCEGALVLLHSARAAAAFADLAGERAGIRLAAISPAAAAAAGEGWSSLSIAAAPRDEALLELALRLCHIAPPEAAATGK